MQTRIQLISGIIRALIKPLSLSMPCHQEIDYLDSLRKERKFIFVTGMHRSGTTYLAKTIGKIAGVSGFENTPGIMDEGQFLQRVYPAGKEFGGMGYFGYHPRSRMLELDPGKARKVGVCLLKDWLTYIDRYQPVFLEKSPNNFRRSRMLASVFPNSHFIHIIRHPVATAIALKAFSPNHFGVKNRSIRSIVDHWTHCQIQALADYNLLRKQGVPVLCMALEDMPRHVAQMSATLAGWLGTEVSQHAISGTLHKSVNEKYQKELEAMPEAHKALSPRSVDYMCNLGYRPRDLLAPPAYDEFYS